MPRKAIPLPSQARLKELFDYDPETGNLLTKLGGVGRRPVGEPAGGLDKGTGYFHVGIDGKIYLLHRVIWAWHNGEIPDEYYVDHVNNSREDSRIENLRLATHSQNLCNRSGFGKNPKGVFNLNSRRNPFGAQISIDGKNTYLGKFKTAALAHAAYCEAANKYHGEFARHA